MKIKLPIEIINRIFLFIKSDISDIIKSSEFYNISFPFLLLNTRERIDTSLSKHQLDCLAYYQYDVYWKILKYQNPKCVSKYQLFHIFTNDKNTNFYSEDTKINLVFKYNKFVILLRKYDDDYDTECAVLRCCNNNKFIRFIVCYDPRIIMIFCCLLPFIFLIGYCWYMFYDIVIK
jgi:hypothetical protein